MIQSKIHSILLLLVVFICSNTAVAQKKPDIKGNKSVAVVDMVLDPFFSIVVEEDLDLSFKKGETPMVHFVADDNLPPIFKFEVRDSVLYISSYYRIRSKKELQIEVSYVALESIEVSGGAIKLDVNSNPSALTIKAKNKADLEVFGIAESISLEIDDASKIKLTSSLNQLNVLAKGRSNLNISGKFNTSIFNLSDKSTLVALGTIDKLELNQSTESYFNGKGFKVNQAKVAMAENAIADFYAVGVVQLALNHQSKFNFYGTAQLDVVEFLGTSQILKKTFAVTQE